MSNDIKYINSDNRRSINIRDVIDDKKIVEKFIVGHYLSIIY